MGDLRVDPGALHGAGSSFASQVDTVRSVTGGLNSSLTSAAAGAAHLDAGDAVDHFRLHVTRQLTAFSDLIQFMAQGLHAAGDDYATTDRGAGSGLGRLP